MSGKLIVVSNRIPRGTSSSGGLVVALHDALRTRGGLWLGTEPVAEGEDDEPLEYGSDPYHRIAVPVPQQLYDDFYLGFSNSVLWPICHRRGDLVSLRPQYHKAYSQVSARMAKAIADLAEPDDLIWVHDYHFLPLAAELRKLHVTARIGFFLHIPFPALGELGAMPEQTSVSAWLAAYDLIGLQTKSDVARCIELYRASARAEFMRNGDIKFGDRVTSIRSFPIGIDVETFMKAADERADPPKLGPDLAEEFAIGVDRLDYSKGLPNRFRAFGHYLENRTDKSRRVSLLQIAPPTREEVTAYRDIRMELEEITGRLNGEHAELDWTPIRYIHRSVERSLLAKLYRKASLALVTPFADGMNLVAKEYMAAQDPEDPGVLVLSRMAGAAEEMSSALLVNPYDIDDMSSAIAAALDMPLEERRERHKDCLRAVRESDVSIWSRNFLDTLTTRPTSVDWRRSPAGNAA